MEQHQSSASIWKTAGCLIGGLSLSANLLVVLIFMGMGGDGPPTPTGDGCYMDGAASEIEARIMQFRTEKGRWPEHSADVLTKPVAVKSVCDGETVRTFDQGNASIRFVRAPTAQKGPVYHITAGKSSKDQEFAFGAHRVYSWDVE